MKTVNLQVRINEDLKQEVSSILKAQGLSYTSMLDALFRQIIKERRVGKECAELCRSRWSPYHCNFNPLYLGKLKVWLELLCLKKCLFQTCTA